MKRTLWVLLDDRRGSVGQARGIITALQDKINIVEKQLVYNKFGWIPNWIRGRSLMGIDLLKSDKILQPWPDLVMSTSRRTVPVARYIRKKSQNSTKIIQLMYPSGGVGIDDMELVVVPAHDNEKKRNRENILTITGAPTKIFPDILIKEDKEWAPIFANLPKPLTAVIVGGAIKNKPWPLESAELFANELKNFHDKIGGSFLITTSRRTGVKAEKIIMEKLKGIPAYTYLWGEKKDNPLMGFYACSDFLVVTADSVSMCSEACGTGKPVLLFIGKDWLTPKHCRFAESLIEKGYATDLTAPNALDFKPSSILNEAALIADNILKIS